MTDRWTTTHRGDEWWYTTPTLHAVASVGAGSVFIGDVGSTNGPITEKDLHELLWSAFHQFARLSVLLEMTKRTRPLIQALARRRVVTWEAVQGAYSEDARVLRVAPLEGQPHNEEL